MTGVLILTIITAGTAYILYKAKVQRQLEIINDSDNKLRKLELRRAFLGALGGVIGVWVLWWSLVAIMRDASNSYTLFLATLSMIPTGIIGAVMGVIVGLMIKKGKVT